MTTKNTKTAPKALASTPAPKPMTVAAAAKMIAGGMASVAKGIAGLQARFAVEGITEKKGKAYAAAGASFRSAWETARGCSEDASRQAWKKYSSAALAGDVNLEGSQSRKPAVAAGSKAAPVSAGPVPAAIVQANASAPLPLSDSNMNAPDTAPGQADSAGAIPLTNRQGLALAVNNMAADMGALGEVIAGMDSKSKAYPALLAAFNRAADTERALRKLAGKVLAA